MLLINFLQFENIRKEILSRVILACIISVFAYAPKYLITVDMSIFIFYCSSRSETPLYAPKYSITVHCIYIHMIL